MTTIIKKRAITKDSPNQMKPSQINVIFTLTDPSREKEPLLHIFTQQVIQSTPKLSAFIPCLLLLSQPSIKQLNLILFHAGAYLFLQY